MKTITSCFALVTASAAAMLVAAGAAHAGPLGSVDNFSGDLSAYTATRILKADTGASDNTYQWEISGGALQINTTSYNAIEQYALTRTDVTLDVGEELRTDYLGRSLDSQDVGLYVGAGTPTADIRADYVSVYARNNGQVFSRGFDGTSELSLTGGGVPASLETLFVTRLTTDTFELGYYADGGVRTVLTTREISDANSAGIGSSIGFYADVRGAGIRGSVDNLQITFAPVAGDVNGDGIVDGDDFGIIRDNLFNTGVGRTSGDLTNDGVVDFADYRQWKDNAGPFASLFSLSVPEPSAALLAALAIAGRFGVRRRG